MSQPGTEVTVEIVIPGDHSVGIDDKHVTMNFGRWPNYGAFLDAYGDNETKGREAFRKGLKEFADTWLDGHKAYIIYGDECGDCGKITHEGKCTDPNCVSNLDGDDFEPKKRVMKRSQMPEYEKLLKKGVRARWMGSNGIQYYIILTRDCVNGNFEAFFEGKPNKHPLPYIEQITEIHLPGEIITIEKD
jgi:hypothetical protein